MQADGGARPRRPLADHHTRPVPHPVVSAYPLDDELIVFDSRSAEAHVLNPTAAFLWSLCDGKHNVEGLVQALVAAYALRSTQAEADVTEFLGELRGAGLMTFE